MSKTSKTHINHIPETKVPITSNPLKRHFEHCARNAFRDVVTPPLKHSEADEARLAGLTPNAQEIADAEKAPAVPDLTQAEVLAIMKDAAMLLIRARWGSQVRNDQDCAEDIDQVVVDIYQIHDLLVKDGIRPNGFAPKE